MKVIFSRICASFLTIRTLVALWAGSVFLVWSVLVVGWFTAKRQLEDLGNRVIMDVQTLDAARVLELEVLAHRREDLLWEATGQDYHRRNSDARLREAERIAMGLDPYVTTAPERELLVQIRTELTALPQPLTSVGSVEVEAQSIYKLLDLVDRFQAQNKSQMEESVRAATRLHAAVSDWALALSVGTAVLLVTGALSFIGRVVRPALALTDVARSFGRGDFAARVAVARDDELGLLGRTFNNMAADIAQRENNRLQFVAMVAHDLKNPVLAIEMAARVLRRSVGDEQERNMYLDAMDAEAKRLKGIVRDLTDDIQVASGRLSVRKTPVELCALVRQLVQSQASAFASHELHVQIDEECVVFGDPERLERVVQNLLSNAVKYSPRNTHIRVCIERKDAFALLTVSDEGQGISKEDLHVIFQPFGRGRSARLLAEGTGMGLYVAKQIIEAHGGRIEVESELGHGATFRIRLPLAGVNHAETPGPAQDTFLPASPGSA